MGRRGYPAGITAHRMGFKTRVLAVPQRFGAARKQPSPLPCEWRADSQCPPHVHLPEEGSTPAPTPNPSSGMGLPAQFIRNKVWWDSFLVNHAYYGKTEAHLQGHINVWAFPPPKENFKRSLTSGHSAIW